MEIIPTLDLYNYTEPVATESQYILTSPRSLEACARFGIKPVELLPKTIADFEEDYGSFTENPVVLYKKFEKERLRKLRLCRQERERIIDENARCDSEEDKDDESIDSGDHDHCCAMDDRNNYNWREKSQGEKIKTTEKPSILDYLDGISSCPSRVNTSLNCEESYENRNGHLDDQLSPPNMDCRVLSDSGMLPIQQTQSQKKQEPNEVKISQYFKVKSETSLDDIDDITNALPKTMKENLSLVSKKNQRSEKTEAELQASKWKSRYERQMQKMGTKLNSVEKGRQFGSEIDSNVSSNKWQMRKRPKSPGFLGSSVFHDDHKTDQQIRAERMTQLHEITEKHKRAAETFQESMKQKLQQREYNKLKQQQRKEFQERQLQMMEKDLKLWQQELQAYQDTCLTRASKVVEKRNAITSAKTHDKRRQKEVEHAMLKSRVDEEERRRQEELKQIVDSKDTRSKMIISAKEEFANAGRESANMPRSMKNTQKNSIHSSFDKMAYKGERMARLEQMNSAKKAAQNSLFGINRSKNYSALTLG